MRWVNRKTCHGVNLNLETRKKKTPDDDLDEGVEEKHHNTVPSCREQVNTFARSET